MTEKKWKCLKWLLLIGSFLAAVKLIFVDYTLDEEYQIVMAYRRLQGDTLFGSMWEPHQTSAFGCFILLKLYTMLTHTTEGVVVFIRFCTTLIQLGLSVWLYKVLKKFVSEKYAFLLGLIFFNYVPKLIQIPEFSNMQLWFFTVTVLALVQYYAKNSSEESVKQMQDDAKNQLEESVKQVQDDVKNQSEESVKQAQGDANGQSKSSVEVGKKWGYLILAGIGMSLEVLSYPSCLVLFPVFGVFILFASEKGKKLRDAFLFAITCGVCGALWLLYVMASVPLEDFLRNVQYVLSFDGTHNLDIAQQTKGAVLLAELGETLILLIIVFVAGLLLSFATERIWKKKLPLPVSVVAAAEVVQIFYWVVKQVGYEKPQIIMLVCLLLPIVYIWKNKNETGFFLPAFLGSWAVLIAVLYMSDLGLWNAAAQGILGAIFGLTFWFVIYEKEGGDQVKKQGVILFLLITLALTNIFGKGFTVKYGKTQTNTILGIRNVVRNGPAKGIFSHYMLGYIMDSDYEDFLSQVPEGSKVLIVTNMVEGAGTSPYMFGNYEICHFSIVDPTTYDEKLLTYWELYPEKQPDVIVVDCWYGQLMEDPNNWIMQYIENDFGYREMTEGKYVRFYKK